MHQKEDKFFPKKMGTVNGKLLKGIKYDNKSKIPSLIYWLLSNTGGNKFGKLWKFWSAQRMKKEEGQRAGGQERTEHLLTAFCVMRLHHYLLS